MLKTMMGRHPSHRQLRISIRLLYRSCSREMMLISMLRTIVGGHPFHKTGCEAVVRLLVKRVDVDITVKDNHGCTPLSLAAGYGHEAVVSVLENRCVTLL